MGRRDDGAPPTTEQAKLLLRRIGYAGPVEPVDAPKGLFRVLVPHYGLPPTLLPLDGEEWELSEEDPGGNDRGRIAP